MNRVLNVAAIVVFVVVFLMCGRLNAGVVNVTEGSTSGYMMTDGNTYVIQNSVTFSNATAGCSGMSVESNATVVIYVPKDVTLTAVGANGEGRTGGGAGVCVPSNATLIVIGEGMLIAKGGNAGDGADGENGSNGLIYLRYNVERVAGAGGAGGAGGGGAGAGVGGSGGLGGLAASGDGGNGEEGMSMGVVYVLGSMRIEASAGLAGISGIAGQSGSNGYRAGDSGSATGGGGGGGGGSGSPPTCSIGGGGSSGGAGGRGRNGLASDYDKYYSPGSAGEGGFSWTQNGEGGNGYKGGAAGAEGGAGTLYVSPSATVDVERGWFSATTHPAAQYMISFDANGGQFSSEANSVIATLGSTLPDCIPTPIRQGYLLCGWRDDDGAQYYGGDGTKMLSSYSVLSNIILHAEWTIAPDALAILPTNGTTFESALTVTMSCPIEGATIRYTLNGSDPTVDSLVYKKFKIYEKTTVKAIAFCDDGSHSGVVTASYALGRCADPIISPTDGTIFRHSGQKVVIAQNGEEGVLRYTVDGTDPTTASAIYTGPFTVDNSVVVKAKVFSDSYFDSGIVMANLTREWEAVAIPVITVDAEFTGRQTEVVIACSTPGATIYYTTNGDEPTLDSPKYTGSFWVSESCTIKAVAMCADYLMSAEASRTVTKVWGIGDTMGAPDHAFTTSGDVGFTRVDDATATGGEAMRSGAIGNSAGYGLYTRSVLSTTVHGPGTLTFKWRASCEQDDDYEWDHAEFAVDGVVTARINDVTEWREVEQPITGSGEHVITWTYLKDDSEGAGDDCLWVSDYSWVTDEPYTHESSVPVPYNWICSYFPHTSPEYDRLEAAARKLAANGVDTVEEAYIAGLNPTNQVSKFMAKMELRDGVPVVTWEPDLNENGSKSERLYKVYGKESLSDVDWVYPTNTLHRFFKVTVEMP